ncbi:uncharacterized protein M6G45_017781 [Spheniscus humboldti]
MDERKRANGRDRGEEGTPPPSTRPGGGEGARGPGGCPPTPGCPPPLGAPHPWVPRPGCSAAPSLARPPARGGLSFPGQRWRRRNGALPGPSSAASTRAAPGRGRGRGRGLTRPRRGREPREAEHHLPRTVPKRKCKFTDELQAKYPCFRVGRERWEAECLVCQEGTYVSVARKGSLDLEANVQSMEHKRNVLGDASMAKLPGCFLPADCQSFDAAATATPLGFAAAVLQDCCEPLAGSPGLPTTPDPVLDVLGLQIKTEARLDEALAPFALDHGVDLLDSVPYCGVALGAGEAGTPFPIQIRYFGWKRGGVQSRVIGVEAPLGELAPSATALAWEALESHGLWQQCVAIVGESPSAMLGGLGCCSQGPAEASGLRELLEGVFIATDCPAHLLSNCIQHGADSLDVDLQSLIWKIYTYVCVHCLLRTAQGLLGVCQEGVPAAAPPCQDALVAPAAGYHPLAASLPSLEVLLPLPQPPPLRLFRGQFQ